MQNSLIFKIKKKQNSTLIIFYKYFHKKIKNLLYLSVFYFFIICDLIIYFI